MLVQPYLFFDGRCDEALEFYRTALGAEITTLMRFKDAPKTETPPEGCMPMPDCSEDKVMHSAFKIGETTIMASDGHSKGQPRFEGVSLSISVSTDAEAARIFDALCNGGQVQMPLGKTFYASSFGMVADRFGVSWMVIVVA